MIEDKPSFDKKDSYVEEIKQPEVKVQIEVMDGKQMVKSDLHKLYKRIAEVNKLQLKYFIEKDENGNNKEVDDVYYKLKNRAHREGLLTHLDTEKKEMSLKPQKTLIRKADISHDNPMSRNSKLQPSVTFNMTTVKPLPSIKSTLTLNNTSKKSTADKNKAALSDLFNDDYLKQNEQEIQKYLNKAKTKTANFL